MHIKESEEIIEVLSQMKSAVSYLAEHVDWRKHNAQEDFERLLHINLFLYNTSYVLRLLSDQHGGSLMKLLCEFCDPSFSLSSADENTLDFEPFCSDCRDKMNAAISITMNKRMKAALTKKES